MLTELLHEEASPFVAVSQVNWLVGRCKVPVVFNSNGIDCA